MTDERRFLDFMDSFGMKVDKYEEQRFLAQEAKELGSTVAYGIRETVDFYFDSRGKFVGSATDQRNSFRSARSHGLDPGRAYARSLEAYRKREGIV